ncbi:universal stress protein [Halobacteria archaeon AArc-m2/3/4]|uniref:Universal stress protein n=1 Tax=Natronoglomus mannanivorans TaxID=2979990 RepID=A0AAP2Z6C8_9EURY|nr:universal stress protein [Halobacteria archaeon AArc-xg1-1]MCU4972084.1 universal stress protein [Halobacteria archaeon AArc-m2/3/4]
MKKPLVVTDPSDRAPELIREAGERAADAGVPLCVLTVVSQDEFEKDSEVLGKIARTERTDYELSPAEYAEEVAQTAVSDLLSDLEIETETIGRGVGDDKERADAILEVAAENDCDYIFMVGRRRSPTGKVLFGDTAQKVILNFEDYVVTLTE